MNTEQLAKRKSLPHRLRPIPLRFAQDGRQLPPRDDQWTLEDAKRKGIVLNNSSTGHNLTIGPDNVQEFRTPDFLMLKCQVIIHGPKVLIEPFTTRP